MDDLALAFAPATELRRLIRDREVSPVEVVEQTLRRIEKLRPSVVYPGHRGVIDDAAARAAEIRAHHAERLDVHEQVLRDGAETAYEVGRAVWGDGLGLHERRFALVEAISHLERLEVEGRAVRPEPARWHIAP